MTTMIKRLASRQAGQRQVSCHERRTLAARSRRRTSIASLLNLAAQLRGAGDTDPAHLRPRWRRAGMRAFEADKEAALLAVGKREEGQPGMEVAG